MIKKLFSAFAIGSMLPGLFILSACAATGAELLGGAGIAANGDTVTPEASPTSTETPTPEPTETPTPTPTLGVGSNLISSDGMTLMYIPAGDFTMGSQADAALTECQKYRPDCILDWFADEEPLHTVTLDAFWIDQTEVTNGMYSKCVAAGVCNQPSNISSSTRGTYYGNPEFDDYPVVFVDWDMANAYCAWAGRRLPTEAEWEKSARGSDGRTLPWGEDISCDKANYFPGDNYCVGDTTKVGSYESGKSPYGVYDMAGNVWEWVNDFYDSTYYQQAPSSNPLGPDSSNYRILRGGSWYGYYNDIRSADRLGVPPFFINNYAGFRCAESASP